MIVVFSPQASEERVGSVLGRVEKIVTESGNSITKREQWGIRRLAYPIKRLREGNYQLLQFKLDTLQVSHVDTTLRVSEDVLRHLLVTV
ncbi:MAG: 30S ribosomal protein S6 [Chloroflexi bacterium]|nr:30S ribosomal protein S6 [Chloroflexota bacterium]